MKKNLYLLLVAFGLVSCTMKPEFSVPEKTELHGLATPIQLQPGETKVYMADYFPETNAISLIKAHSMLKAELSADRNELLLTAISDSLPPMTELMVSTQNASYSIPVLKSKKTWYTFRFDPKGKMYQTVQIAGDVNGWNPKATNLELKDQIYSAGMWLYPGKYAYQLVLDGKWMLDRENPDSAMNNTGGYNSVISAGSKPETPLVLKTHRYHKKRLMLAYNQKPREAFVYWENFRIPREMVKIGKSNLRFFVPEQAKHIKRSFIRAWVSNEYGISNDVLIPLHYGEILNSPDSLERTDKHTMIMYFLMVDRFVNGELTNDKPLRHPEVNVKADYFGGDLAGITKKINDGYFEKLGTNVIWISPITQNPTGPWGLYKNPKTKFSGYHGYWPVTLTTVDTRFGNNESMKNFVESAHGSNMNVLLDYVAHHIHQEHPIASMHPEWQTNLYMPDGSLNTERWDECRLTTWFDTFLPTLDLSKPEVVGPMSDSAMFWLQNYGIDGFRHDATKHVPELFWRTLTKKIKTSLPQAGSVYQIGETYGNRELIGSYVSTGQMDGQFDFNVYDDAVSVFARENVETANLKRSLEESLGFFGHHNLMGYITGNQDRPRFMSLAGKSLRFDEDAKLAGWTRQIGVGDSSAYQKMALLNAFNMSIPGIPVVYYGDEIGMPGGNDPDNRRMMYFENWNTREKQLFDKVSKLAHLRRSNLAAMYGSTRMETPGKDVLIIYREYFDQVFIVILNKGDKEVKILPDAGNILTANSHFEGSFTLQNGKLEAVVSPLSFQLITAKKKN